MIKRYLSMLLLAFTMGGMHGRYTNLLSATTRTVSVTGTDSGNCSVTPCRTIQYGVNQMASGDILNVTAGTYADNGGGVTIRNKAFGTETIIQANGWTASLARTQDTVIVEGTETSPTWLHCSGTTGACNSPCGIVGPGACNLYWYIVGTGNYKSPVAAKTPDGSPTYLVQFANDMTNAHSNYVSGRCTVDTWRACHSSSDCDTGQTCTAGAGIEYDAYTTTPGDGSVGTLYVRWGSTVPSGAYIVNSTGGFASGRGIYVENSTNVTVRGFIIRNTSKPGLSLQVAGSNIKFIDNRVAYNCYLGGPDYSLEIKTASAVTVDHNELMGSCSEAVHTQAFTNGSASDYTITNNWIHLVSDDGIQGPWAGSGNGSRTGTPQGMIITDDYAGGGNYTGTVIDGNYIDFSSTLQSDLTGIRLEDRVTGARISNNILNGTSGAGLFFATEFVGESGISAFNNIFYGCGRNASQVYEKTGIAFGNSSLGGADTNNSIFNNTIVMKGGTAGVFTESGGVAATGNIFRNNIIRTPEGTPAVSWSPTSTTNKFQYNMFATPNIPIISFGGIDYATCSDFDSAEPVAGGNNVCDDPGFYDTTHFLFYPMGGSGITPGNVETNASFAPSTLDAGTATGMPAAKTTGIVNTLATSHGFGFYSDSVSQGGAAWDIGAVESLLSYGNTPVGWSVYTPTGCSGGAPNNPGTDGNGFVFQTQRDPATLCSGVSTTMTLTVGHQYYVYLRSKAARSVDDVTVDAATPPNYAIAADNTCGSDRVDDWSVDATNATIEEARYGSTNPNRGNFDSRIPHVYLLTPTSASVTLKVQVKSGGIFLTCPDTVYFFDPIVVVPIRGHCSITKYRSCNTSADCPIGGETCL